MIVLGDIHGQWEHTARLIEARDLRDETIVQVGDFGVGFDAPEREAVRLDTLDAVLAARGLTLYAIRGNHDDPAAFGDDRYDRPRLRLVRDYTTLDIDGRRVLCVGGAASPDRVARRRQGLRWWPEEVFVPRPDLLDGPPDIVVTHSAPDFCPPVGPGRLIQALARHDPALVADLRRERADLTALHAALDRRRLQLWLYGHFHQSLRHEHDGVRFIGLQENELLRAT
jgi:predicted phosphodiesterase